jgi:hypothetical protein
MKMAVAPRKVGEIAVQETLNGKLIIVPGTGAKLMSIVLRALPRRLAVVIYNSVGKKK